MYVSILFRFNPTSTSKNEQMFNVVVQSYMNEYWKNKYYNLHKLTVCHFFNHWCPLSLPRPDCQNKYENIWHYLSRNSSFFGKKIIECLFKLKKIFCKFIQKVYIYKFLKCTIDKEAELALWIKTVVRIQILFQFKIKKKNKIMYVYTKHKAYHCIEKCLVVWKS